MAVAGDVVEILPNGKIRVREPFSEPILVPNPDKGDIVRREIQVEPVGDHDKNLLDEWQKEFGKYNYKPKA